MRRATLPVVCIAALAASGCYHYVPATIESVAEGARVRALLTPQAQQRLREQWHLDAPGLEGTLLSRNGDQVALLVPSGPMVSEFGTRQVLYQHVELGRGDIVRTDIRRLDGFKTAALLAVAAAATTLVIVESTSGGEPPQRPPPEGGEPESVRGWLILIPLVRW